MVYYRLSEQQLIDCASTYGNNGCQGGWYEYAWKYIQLNGQVTNQSYPYQAKVVIFYLLIFVFFK